jgi:choline kinase
MMAKAVILSAGQGSRLLPFTAATPKCLIEIDGESILDRQVNALTGAGITDIVVVTGFQDHMVSEAVAQRRESGLQIRTLFNPFYAVSDNVGSIWAARGELQRGGLVLNGDTIVSTEIVRRLISRARFPISLCSDSKPVYDGDDMKIAAVGERVIGVSKSIPAAETSAEAIGLAALTAAGAQRFLLEVETLLREPGGISQYYLRAIERAARDGSVGHVQISGLAWCEIDYPADIATAMALFSAQPCKLIA